MADLRFSDRDRATLLAAAVIDYLNETFSESELDDDSNPLHTDLYNLAAAVQERHDAQGGEEHCDRELRLHAEYSEPGAFDAEWAKLVQEIPGASADG